MKKFTTVAISLVPLLFGMNVMSGQLPAISFAGAPVFGQGTVDSNNTTSSTAEVPRSMPNGSIGLTNFDIPSIDITLPDGSTVSPDLRSIYFNSGGKGDTIYAYYDDYGIPDNKPQLKVSDKFIVDVYRLNPNTPKLSNVQVSISKILSGNETERLTDMKLDKAIDVISNGNTFSVPNTEPGNYILDTFVNYPFGGIVLVYSIQTQILE